MTTQVESLSVGYEDRASAAANAVADAIRHLGEEAQTAESRVARLGKGSEQLAKSFSDTERLAAKVTAATKQFRQALDELDRSELNLVEKEKLRTSILQQQEQAVQRVTAQQERYLAGMRAMEAAAGAQTAGMAASTAAAGDRTGALDRNYDAATRLIQQEATLNKIHRESAGTARLTANEMGNLASVILDTASQLGGGQGPFLILMQQGLQAVEAVGGVSRAMALLASPAGLATMGALALGGAMAVVIERAVEVSAHTRRLSVDIQAMGNASGVSAGQLRAIETQLRQQGVSSDAAFASVRTLAGARGLPSSILGDVASIGRNMAAGTDDVAESVKGLTDTLTEGYTGIRKLDDQFNFLTVDERRQIEAMARHGDQAGVLKTSVDALHRQFDGLHEKALSPAGAAMERLSAGYNRLLDSIASRPIVIKGLEALALLLDRTAGSIGEPTKAERVASIRRELSDLDAQYSRLPEATSGIQATHEAIILRRIDLMQQLTKLEKENSAGQPSQISTGAPRTAGTSNARSGMPDPAAAKYVSEQATAFERLSEAMQGNAAQRTLAQAEMQAEEDISNRRLRGTAADEIRIIRQKEALLQLTVAVNDNNRAAAAEVAGADLVARAYGQSTAAVREAEIQSKALTEVARGTIEPYDAIVKRLRLLDDAQRKVQAASFDATLRQQVEDANRLAAAWGNGADAAREAGLANEALAEARKRGLDPSRDAGQIRDIGAGILARDAAQRSQQFAQMAAEQRRAVDLANAEYDTLGQSNAERAKTLAVLQTTNELRDKGVDLTDAGTQAYIRQAGELARFKSQMQDAAQNAASVAQPIATAFEDVILGAKKAGDAGKALAEELRRVFVHTVITKPAETWLTGTLTKLMSGPIDPVNDNTPKPANDPGTLDRIVGSVKGGLGSSSDNAMWVRMAGSASAVALDPQALTGRPMPVAVKDDKGAGIAGLPVTDAAPLPVAIKDGGQVADLIRSESRAQGVPEEVGLAIAKMESGFRQYHADGRLLTSSAGAMGVMQLMPGTAKWLGVDATDTQENVRGGIKYLAMLGRQFGGDWTTAAAAYNAGPTRVQQYLTQGRALPAETVTYIERFGATVKTVGTDVSVLGTRVGGVTKAQEDALQAQLDAANTAKVATGSAQDLNASQSALVASVLGTTAANDNAASVIEVQSRAVSHIGENAISAAGHLDDAADGAKALAKASDSAGDTLLAGAQSVYNGFSDAVSGIWNWVAGLFSGVSGGGAATSTTSGQAGAASGSSGGVGNLLSLGSKFMPSSWTSSITSSIDSWGASALGIGTAAAPGMTAAAGGAAQAAGVAAVPGGITNAAVANGAVTGGLTSYLGPIGGGFAAGSLIGPMVANGNKAVGGLAGAASGAAVGALIGSVIPGIGTLVGALIGGASGGLGGLLGTQKPTVGPTASADITINTGGKSATSGNYLTDNDGDPKAAQQLGSAFSAIFTAAASGGGVLAKDFGIGQTATKGLYVAGSVPYKEFGKGDDALGNLLRYTLLEQGGLTNAGPNVTKAIQNTKASSYEDAAKDIGLGATIDAGITALSELDKSLAGVTRSAKNATTESLKPMLEELDRAKKLGIGDSYVGLATAQLKGYLEQLKNPVDWTQGEQDMATLTGQFQALRDAAVQLDPALATTVDQIEAETRARTKQRAETDAKRLLNSASGHEFLNQITDLGDTRDKSARNLAAAGADISVAGDIFNAALTSLLTDLNPSELDLVTRSFGGDIGALAQTLKTTGKAAVEAAANLRAYNADLQSRMHAAVGNVRGSGLLTLDQQQSVEMAKAKADGYDTSVLALVQGAERGQKAFELAQADVLAWYDQEIGARQTFIGELQDGALKVAQAAKQFAAARDALAISSDAPISPQERLTEVKRQWDAALGTVRSATASDEDKDTARSNLINLGQTLVSIEKENSAGTARTLYDMVLGVEKELGTLAPDSAAATADAQIKVAQDSLKELQKARADAASMGQRQLGSLDGLKDTMGQSLAVWQAALSPLQQLTGTTSTTPRYSAPASVQTAWDTLSVAQQGGIAQAMGWGGQVDEAFNFWLGSSASRRSDFESRVLAAGGGASTPRYGAPADVQSGWDGLSGAQQVGIVRAMGWTGSIDQAFNAWLATDGSRAATFESHVRTIAGGAVYSASADIMRAWEALSADQQALAVRMAGYPGGVDAGLNAWVRLGHQADFESAVRARAKAAGIPRFWTGTLSTPPGAMWVGETGPELLWQGGGAAVASSADSLRIVGMHQTAANDSSPPPVAPIRPPAGPLASDNREILAVLRDIARRIERLETSIHEAEGEAQTQRSRIAQDEITLMRQQLDELREQQVKRAA
ncbi:hypothetical protein J2848_005623 [Azospirillum lipoferum]|uniref:Transglycosylase SLT domain-containing protein n=1 Tax=Azospirillum lipoferum TaxID=193 RepID=A0A5A9GF37_AZOLI|nr:MULTISPECIES: phage tail length tape measure family protein [Azospirillum]KAA0593016.1 transglycosylase SLT domain-containing protein [Azospirillum lipoferum]MCP1613922.1 hypothetical protein [Azospirillum lipoferum]MDW5537683.1 phage tail length tape measure family protein [Azospirillum sp. NL1]